MKNSIYLKFKELLFENITNNLILYHGSNNDFEEFDLNFFNAGSFDGGWLGYGVYLTNDYEYAESYGDVYKCKVDVQNPLILTDIMYSMNPDKLKNEFNAKNSRQLTSILTNKGYDSVILTYNDETEEDFVEICVFNPNKIKIIDKNI